MEKLMFDLDHNGYVVKYYNNNVELEASTYRDYLDQYCSDEITSPRGVEHREFIKEVPGDIYKHITTGEYITAEECSKLNKDERLKYRYYGEDIAYYDVMMWGAADWPQFVKRFYSRDDAEMYIYIGKELNRRRNWDIPEFFGSREEAIQAIADSSGHSPELIERFFAIRDVRRKREKREREVAKAERSRAAKAEADSIIIDDTFRAAIAAAESLENKAKQSVQIAATKALLARNNIERIQSDFWQVFRILKQKATT